MFLGTFHVGESVDFIAVVSRRRPRPWRAQAEEWPVPQRAWRADFKPGVGGPNVRSRSIYAAGWQ